MHRPYRRTQKQLDQMNNKQINAECLKLQYKNLLLKKQLYLYSEYNKILINEIKEQEDKVLDNQEPSMDVSGLMSKITHILKTYEMVMGDDFGNETENVCDIDVDDLLNNINLVI